MQTTDQQMRIAAKQVANAAKAAYDQWAALSRHRVGRQIAAEAAGLLDCLTGILQTNPEERAQRHVDALRRLVRELGTTSPSVHLPVDSSSSNYAGR